MEDQVYVSPTVPHIIESYALLSTHSPTALEGQTLVETSRAMLGFSRDRLQTNLRGHVGLEHRIKTNLQQVSKEPTRYA